MQNAILALADGSVFRGRAIGADGIRCGELVFNTAMTGYQEILTDPSYAGQIVTLTYPHIGNTGVNALDVESGALQAAGLVVRDAPATYSSWRASGSLSDYLRAHGIIGIADVDTREITRRLRTHGAQNACLMAGEIDEAVAIAAARAHPSMSGQDLASGIGIKSAQAWTESVWDATRDCYPEQADGVCHVVAYDYGIKANILRLLVASGCRVTLVPAATNAQEALALAPRKIPVFGICLGHQLLGLACGAQTVKMKFGHHGANHPVQDLASGRVMITSQNHGFAVDEATLPDNVRATHRSLFDGSLQGLAFTDRPVFAFQGHPEASPGPHDAEILFAQFVEAMRAQKA